MIQSLLNGKSGAQEIYNTKGAHLLAGYSYIPESKWGVVSQTPYESSLQPLNGIMTKMFFYTIPFVIVIFRFSLFVIGKISFTFEKFGYFYDEFSYRRCICR